MKEFVDAQKNDEVIMALDKSKNNFRQNLRQDGNDDMIILLIQLVGEKICGIVYGNVVFGKDSSIYNENTLIENWHDAQVERNKKKKAKNFIL